MGRFEKFAVAFLLLLGLAGCRVGWLIERIAPDAIRNGRGYFDELRHRQVDRIIESFDPAADKDQLRSDLVKVIALVPQQEPVRVETLGATAECKGSGICTKEIVLEYTYPDRWILFRVTVSNRSGNYAITNLYVRPESAPLESMTRFTLLEKSPLHYAILLMALVSVGIAVYTLVLCIRTPIRKRKWLWVMVTILGIGKFGIQWSSGELWYKILYISILPGGWGFDVESPFLYASIPAEAIFFLLLRGRLSRTDAAMFSTIVTPSSSAAEKAEGDTSH